MLAGLLGLCQATMGRSGPGVEANGLNAKRHMQFTACNPEVTLCISRNSRTTPAHLFMFDCIGSSSKVNVQLQSVSRQPLLL